MFANTPQMTAGDVLNTLYRDAPYLFLGGAFVSIGLMSAAYAALRRAWDSLLIYFALFAAMYGVRLWIQSRILAITMDGSAFYTHLRSGIDYLMLIPAFLFFTSLGLPGRLERIVGYAAGGIGGVLAVVAFSFHDSNLLHLINNVVVITGLVFLLVRSMQAGSAGNENFPAADFAVIRWGLLPFFLLALWVNWPECCPFHLRDLSPSASPPSWRHSATWLPAELCAAINSWPKFKMNLKWPGASRDRFCRQSLQVRQTFRWWPATCP